jgi:hypothetical protein
VVSLGLELTVVGLESPLRDLRLITATYVDTYGTSHDNTFLVHLRLLDRCIDELVEDQWMLHKITIQEPKKLPDEMTPEGVHLGLVWDEPETVYPKPKTEETP